MTAGRINEIGINQASHSPEDAIGIGQNVLKVTIKNAADSGTNAFVGVNDHASNKNLLQPGESVTYHDERVYLDENSYYLAFDPANQGGRVLVSIILDTKKEVCN
ncbi:MAG TPA: hypothetical protein VK589_30015 [Chryseolinea sp.]|nr:hypothetical protein [Chryseolinea sp.]